MDRKDRCVSEYIYIYEFYSAGIYMHGKIPFLEKASNTLQVYSHATFKRIKINIAKNSITNETHSK